MPRTGRIPDESYSTIQTIRRQRCLMADSPPEISMTSFGLFGIRLHRTAVSIPCWRLRWLCFATPAAHAWGCQGHETVALIAEMHMSPAVLAKVNQILKDGPIDPTLNRYCKDAGLTPMADAASWPDDLRGTRPEASPWHYIDIPRGGAKADMAAA